MTGPSRRAVLGGFAAGAALAAPAVLDLVHAQEKRRVRVLAWGDYLGKELREAFEEKTKIAVELSTYGSNEAAEMRLRAAEPGRVDLIFPTLDTGPNYYRDGLLQPIDEARLEVDRILPSLARASLLHGGAHEGARHLVPFNWGTEAVTWAAASHSELAYGELSYADLWAGGEGQATIRPWSALIALVLLLDARGEVPSDRGRALFVSPAEARRVLDAAASFAERHIGRVGAIWRNATEAKQALTREGCTIGQVWDSTALRLHRETDPGWRYTMPAEGGLGWMDTMAIPAAAENPDEAYELINFLLTPEAGALFANRTGYNSAAVGAAEQLDDALKALYEMAYPDDAAIDNIWWWSAVPPYLARLGHAYAARLRRP